MTPDSRASYDEATAGLSAPLAIVDQDAFDANAADLRRRANGLPIRVASKSIRCRALLERALATDGFRGVLGYSLAEALWLWRTKTSRDVVVGYPTVDAAALTELAGEPDALECITLMVDSGAQLDLIDRVLGAEHPTIRVALELDGAWRPARGVHIGARRSPVHDVRAARQLAESIARRRGFRLVGVMAYEGQIAGVGDRAGGARLRSLLLRGVQALSAREIARRRAAVVRAVADVTELEFVNGGGTGSLETTSRERAVTEVAAGSGLLGPTLFDDYRRFRPRPALLFGLPVVRRPGPGVVTLGYGGYVASGPAASSRLPSPVLPAGLRLSTAEGVGEVQTPVFGAAADDLVVGERVWFRHAKAGELAERFTEYHLVSGGELVETAATYRGEGQCFG